MLVVVVAAVKAGGMTTASAIPPPTNLVALYSTEVLGAYFYFVGRGGTGTMDYITFNASGLTD